jgi:hypothetical protein
MDLFVFVKDDAMGYILRVFEYKYKRTDGFP